MSAGQDKQLFVWDVEGNELPSWHGVGRQSWPHSEMPRVNDMAMSRDGSHLVREGGGYGGGERKGEI